MFISLPLVSFGLRAMEQWHVVANVVVAPMSPQAPAWLTVHCILVNIQQPANHQSLS